MRLSRRFFAPVLLTTTVIFLSCGGSAPEDPQNTPAAANPEADRAVPVRVRAVIPEPFTETLHLTGYAKAVEDVIISTEEGGVLQKWLKERGDAVRRGEVLGRLKEDILRPQYDAALAQYRLAELNYERQKAVFAEQGISELQFKTLESNRDAAKAQADFARARWERTRIVSPVDGFLDDRMVDEGELAMPLSPVARVVNLRHMKVALNVAERFVGTIRKGNTVRFTVDALRGESFTGKITFIGSAVVPDNRTLPIEVRVLNPRGAVKPDMIVRATVVQTAARKAIQIEESLVQQIDQKTFVIYVVEDDRARRRTIILGGRNDDRVEVTGGLREGDRVIVSGQQNVLDGQLVTVEQPEQNGESLRP